MKLKHCSCPSAPLWDTLHVAVMFCTVLRSHITCSHIVGVLLYEHFHRERLLFTRMLFLFQWDVFYTDWNYKVVTFVLFFKWNLNTVNSQIVAVFLTDRLLFQTLPTKISKNLLKQAIKSSHITSRRGGFFSAGSCLTWTCYRGYVFYMLPS